MFALIFYRWLIEAGEILLNMDGVSCNYLMSKHFAQNAVCQSECQLSQIHVVQKLCKGYSNAVQILHVD